MLFCFPETIQCILTIFKTMLCQHFKNVLIVFEIIMTQEGPAVIVIVAGGKQSQILLCRLRTKTSTMLWQYSGQIMTTLRQ